MTDERIEKMNEWLKTTISIGTERVSCEIEGDYLTKWDEDSYHVVHYLDGRVDKTLSFSKRPSVMLKHIEKVFNDWSLELNIEAMEKIKKREKRYFSTQLRFGNSWIIIYMNDIHQDMISDDQYGRWYSYKDGMLEVGHQIVTLEEWIASVILKEAKKYPSDIQLQRSIKLKALVK
jgi:hypothetical protein